MTTAPELDAIHRDLAAARDAQLVRVVGMLDSMPERGAAETLLAPLRGRLRRLHVPHPLRFGRLLFLPLDPVIVPPPRWRPDTPFVPRTALAPLEGIVRRGLGAIADAIENEARGHATDEDITARMLGARLWPAAGAALGEAAQAAPPPDWAAAGLSGHGFAELLVAVGAILTHAPALQDLLADQAAGRLPPAAVEALLRAILPRGPESWAMIVALLLRRLPQAEAVIRGFSGMRPASERAIEAVLHHLAQDPTADDIVAAPLDEAAREVERLSCLLEGVGAGAGPARRRTLHAIRHRMDAACRRRFADAMQAELLEPMAVLPPGADAAAVERLEATARALRGFEGEARRISAAPQDYDALLRDAAAVVEAFDDRGGFTRADRVRMVELLAGPERAVALLDR